MNSPDRQWWIAQSGEYVLGTLNHADWVAFSKATEHDEDAMRLVIEWQETFQPLSDALTPVMPSERVWLSIENRINQGGDDSQPNNILSLDVYKARAKKLEQRIDRWRSAAGLATAASILLATLAWVTHTNIKQIEQTTPVVDIAQFDSISIIRDKQSLPLWVVDTSLSEGLVRVTAIEPPDIDADKSYQLWLVKPDNTGVQSMGLIPTDTDKSLLLKVGEQDNNAVAYAVSLEPLGGSPEDVPTGPVLYQGGVQKLDL